MTTIGSVNTGTTTYSSGKFPFTIWVTPECLVKMNEYGRAAQPTEVGGLARIEIDREGKNIFVTDIHVFEQVANAAHFQIPVEAMMEWTRQMVKDGRSDELAEWKSIFHTHPIGMGPNMSGEDVDELKNFAAEGDAFSFILTASNTADSARFLMHYCCNFYGAKHVIKDIDVKRCISSDRLAMCDNLTNYLFRKLGGSSQLNDKDKEVLDTLVTEFLTNKVPTYFSQGRAELRADIEEHVKAVVKKESYGHKRTSISTTPKTGDYAAGADRKSVGEAIEADAYNAMIQDAVQRGEITEGEAADYAAWLTAEEQEFIGYSKKNEKYDRRVQVIEELFALAFDRYDVKNPNNVVGVRRAKKAARMWESRVKTLNKELREETEEGIGLNDLVLVDFSKIESNRNNKTDSDLATVPHTVDAFHHDQTGFSFEVGGELFWSHELEVVEKFEDKMDRIRETARLNHELGEIDEKKKLQEASAALDTALTDGPGDTTSTDLVTTK